MSYLTEKKIICGKKINDELFLYFENKDDKEIVKIKADEEIERLSDLRQMNVDQRNHTNYDQAGWNRIIEKGTADIELIEQLKVKFEIGELKICEDKTTQENESHSERNSRIHLPAADRETFLIEKWENYANGKHHFWTFISFFIISAGVIFYLTLIEGQIINKVVIPACFLLITLFLSFWNRDKVLESFNFYFRKDNLRRKKTKEFEEEFNHRM